MDNRLATVDIARLEAEFKRNKARVKSNFTRSRNKLLLLLEGEELPSRRAVRDACQVMDTCMEIAMDILTNFSDFYFKNEEIQKAARVTSDMEKLDDEYHAAYETATEYLESRQDDRSSVASNIITIDMLKRMKISDSLENESKEEIGLQESVRMTQDGEVRELYCDDMPKISESSRANPANISNELKQKYGYKSYLPTTGHITQSPYEALDRDNSRNPINTSGLNASAATFEPVNREYQSIGQDLWRQLKRVQIPVFDGDKRKYQSWKAAFNACIDSAPATGEYKLLQLRQYLSGEALQAIENLGHSAIAYEAARERLERKFGGKRRQIAVYLEDLERFRQVRPGNAKDLEHFADLLDIAIINLEEAGQHHELGDGSLYTKLQRKLSESMLARYHRWVFENNITESVAALRKWVIQEAEFQTIASETVHGLTGKEANNQPYLQSLPRNKSQRTFFGESKKTSVSCIVCGGKHAIWRCQKFAQKTPSERWNIAKRSQMCYRCLAEGHYGKSCPNSRPCGKNGCQELHHRLLHQYNRKPEASMSASCVQSLVEPKNIENQDFKQKRTESVDQIASVTEGKGQKSEQETTMMSQDGYKSSFVTLRTVPVMLKNGGRTLKVNALLDDASTKTYLNADVAAELGLQGQTEKVTVNVLNNRVETFETKPVNFKLESIDGRVSAAVTAYTSNRVTGNMQAVEWNICKGRWAHLQNINFPRIAKKPILDILIGVDYADLLYSIKEVKGGPGEPIARLTPLGWTCIGNTGWSIRPILQASFSNTFFSRDQTELEEINASLKKFWELDQVPSLHEKSILRIDEQLALKKVQESLRYEHSMYRVGVPWKENEPVLPNNYEMALKRLQNTEKRLQRSPDIRQAYSDILEQYIAKGYVRKVQEIEKSRSKWYLPHFPVIRPDKDTTKTRIVFDASAKCNGVSLNDEIHQGPKLQRELFDVLLRFRRFPVAVVCDIAEMYLRIGIAQEDKPYFRFLWSGKDQNRVPDVYEFDRVVFGVNSSPFQAQFVLQQHAKKFKQDFPLAAETIEKSTYMDDSMDSVQSEQQGKELYKQLSLLLSKAGMHARKWLSNSFSVLSDIPLKDRKAEVDLDRSPLPCAKTLGVWWLADKDIFTFKESMPDSHMTYTKRNFLKKIATLFDPLGFLSPFTIRAKILLQDMWTAGIDWDEELTGSLIKSARAWFAELCDLRQIQVPRCLSNNVMVDGAVSLHTFVDASETAFGAVVYARCLNTDGNVSNNIIASKTRVSPSTATSIPRLELMGAVVGVRLTARVSDVFGISMRKATFWCDSVNVLWWVRGRSRNFKPFVANRVGEIQTSTDPNQWRYVPTKLNPADMLSRGMRATELAKCATWWKGPGFLQESEDKWPANKIFDKPIVDDETKRFASNEKQSKAHVPETHDEHFHAFIVFAEENAYPVDPTRYSSWLKLRRIQAWINRFVKNCQRKRADRTFGELMVDELKRAEIQLIKQTQSLQFKEEWKALKQCRLLPTNSKLLSLKPRLDDDGLMRSDGRLKNASFLSFDVRYPVILPRKSWVTKLIVKEAHEQGKHAFGTNQTLAVLSARYWIIAAREVIRKWERECAECRRRKAKAGQQIMAPLPLARLQVSLRAFTRTAVDYGGPFITIQGRGKRRQKRYLCLFTCLATRAVHLEIAFGLDTDSFLNAFYRMASRRGLPEEMFSDNGTNFKSADRELQTLLSQLDQTKIKASVANKGIKWHFNPPLAPHFGGVHESMIKSAKKAINAILSQADINDEELMTAIIGAEGLINSRPLTYQSANHEDDVPLTPNHFLHGQMGGQFAPTSVDETQYCPRKRWRRVQELVRHFWQRWLREWLPGLGGRKKWHRQRSNIQVGEVVLVISPDTPRKSWPLGRVLKVYAGDDGKVRVVKVQVGQGTLIRPITKLCPLESEDMK